MKNSHKGFIVPLIIIGVLLIIAAAGYYFAIRKAPASQSPVSIQQISTTTVSTTGWNAYTNTQDNFSFKYPSNFSTTEGSDKNFNYTYVIKDSKANTGADVGKNKNILFTVWWDYTYPTLEAIEAYDKSVDKVSNSPIPRIYTYTEINNQKALIVTNQGDTTEDVYILGEVNNRPGAYTIFYDMSGFSENTSGFIPADKDIFKGIVSTFSGSITTNSNQPSITSNWKTYTNTQYGFSLQFPDSWAGYSVKTTQTTNPNNGDKFNDINFVIAGDNVFTIIPLTKQQWSIYGTGEVTPTFINQNNSYVFAYNKTTAYDPSVTEQEISAIPSIISTFKFVTQTETYTNAQYGFSINGQSGLLLSTSSSGSNESPFNVGVPIVSIPVTNGSNGFDTGYINIGVGTTSNNITDCLDVHPDQETLHKNFGTATINGTRFLHFNSFSVGSGQILSVDSYGTFQNGLCWSIDLIRWGEASSHLTAPQVPLEQADDAQIQNELNTDLQTFRFN